MRQQPMTQKPKTQRPMTQKLEQKLREAKLTAEVDPALHGRLVARLGARRTHQAPLHGRWLWAGAAAAAVLAIFLVIVQGPPGSHDVTERLARLESQDQPPARPMIQPLSGLIAGLSRAPVAPPEQWLRREMEALESDLRKLLPRSQVQTDDATLETASG